MSRVNSKIAGLVCVWLALSAASVSYAVSASLYVNYTGGDNDQTWRFDMKGNQLYQLDPANAVGFIGVENGLCIGPDSTGDGIGEVYRGSYYGNPGVNDTPIICKYDGTTGAFISTVSHSNNPSSRMQGIGFGPTDGFIYAIDSANCNVHRLDPITGDKMNLMMGDNWGPQSIVWGTNGHAFVAYGNSTYGCGVSEYGAWNGWSCPSIRTLDSGNAAALTNTYGSAFGPDGKLYVASGGNNKIVRYDVTSGAYIDDFVTNGCGSLSNPKGIVFGNDCTGDGIADLYVASAGNNKILRFNGSTGAFIDTFATTGLQPSGIAYAPSAGPNGTIIRIH